MKSAKKDREARVYEIIEYRRWREGEHRQRQLDREAATREAARLRGRRARLEGSPALPSNGC